MKVLVFVSIFIHFLNTTAGLECYRCDDYASYYVNDDDGSGHVSMSCGQWNETTTCDRGSKFCLTYEFLDSDNCNTEVCFQMDCDWLDVCKSVGTRKMRHPLSHMEKVEVTCCQGDMCNSPGQSGINLPSSHNNRSNQNCLFYALFSSFLSSGFVTF